MSPLSVLLAFLYATVTGVVVYLLIGLLFPGQFQVVLGVVSFLIVLIISLPSSRRV